MEIYKKIIIDETLDYSSFIDYLAKETYMPLMQSSLLELEKNKLANSFIDLLTKYLEESDA